ncbi:MAG: NAD-dependent epimerase/dehydratase family protein [Gemmatimonadaceae bacterium]
MSLVTGGTGFVGRSLVRRLVGHGQRVALIVRNRSGVTTLGSLADRVEVHEHDGSLERMSEIVAAVRPSVVYHLASLSLVEHKPEDVRGLIESNIVFGTQLLEAMRVNGIHQLVNTGTYWQYASDGSYDPMCLYAATKQAFEAILVYYSRAYGLRSVTLVLFDTYGPGDSRRKLIPQLLETNEFSNPLDLSPGFQRIALTYVEDVIDAFERASILAAELPNGTCESWDVRGAETIELREVVDVVSRQCGRNVPVRWGARDYRPRERMIPFGTGRTLPGWTARTSLREGIRHILGE